VAKKKRLPKKRDGKRALLALLEQAVKPWRLAIFKLRDQLEEDCLTQAPERRHLQNRRLVENLHDELLLKPTEIAERSCLNKRAVLRDIRDGKFGDYFCRACAGFSITDRLIFLREHRLNARSFKNSPAPTVRFDFDYCHRARATLVGLSAHDCSFRKRCDNAS
jgi:hypothetical protein